MTCLIFVELMLISFAVHKTTLNSIFSQHFYCINNMSKVQPVTSRRTFAMIKNMLVNKWRFFVYSRFILTLLTVVKDLGEFKKRCPILQPPNRHSCVQYIIVSSVVRGITFSRVHKIIFDVYENKWLSIMNVS